MTGRGVSSRVFLSLILITDAVVALPQLPRPWLTRDDSVSILDITCDIQRQESPHNEQGTKVQRFQLKLQAKGSMENVTLATASSEGWNVTKGPILDSIASVELSTFKSDGQTGFALTGLHLVTPFIGQLAGKYFLDVHRINETNCPQVVFSYSFDNIDCLAGEKRVRMDSVFTVQCVPAHKLNITWVPPPSDSEPTMVNVDRVLSGMPFLSPVNVYKVNQTTQPSTHEVLLVQSLKPRCGVTNYTIIMFVSPLPSKPCIPSGCNYTCKVWYPECEEGDMGKYCECGAPPPDDRETALAQNTSTDCDYSTETEANKQSMTATLTTSNQAHAHSTTPPSSINEMNTVSNNTHSPQTSPSYKGEIAPPEKSVDNSGQCFGQCTAFRAVAIIMSAIAGLVLLFAVIMVRRCLKSAPRNSEESGGHPLLRCVDGLAGRGDADQFHADPHVRFYSTSVQ